MDITSTNLHAAMLDQRIAAMFAGKRYAFTVVLAQPRQLNNWGVGVAIENERGYHPIVAMAFSWPEREKAEEFCDSMNEHIGLTAHDAAKIIASTMRSRVSA